MNRLFLTGRFGLAIILGNTLSACVDPKNGSGPAVPVASTPCDRVWTERNESGELKRFRTFSAHGRCYKENVSLSHFEETEERWNRIGKTCVPQPLIQSQTWVSWGNYYSYRDGRVLISLDAATGIYRRIRLAEGRAKSIARDENARVLTLSNGQPVFNREQGCFYVREATGVDAAFGTQILFDTEDAMQSEYFAPPEVYKLDQTGPNSILATRFDSTGDWDFRFCPELDTPWGFCDFLRNGNIMFYPVVTAANAGFAEAARLEAILIRQEHRFEVVTNVDFEDAWSNPWQFGLEASFTDWKYAVDFLVDTPRYTYQAWFDFIKGERPRMPDVTSPQIPPVCYQGLGEVASSVGTAWIQGEVCYQNGQYVFTQ